MRQIARLWRVLTTVVIMALIVAGVPAATYGSPGSQASEVNGLLGLYKNGGEHFLIRERDGVLEMLYDSDSGQESLLTAYTAYPLNWVSKNSYRLVCAGPLGKLTGIVTFKRDTKDLGIGCLIGNKGYERYFYGPDKGLTFRIQPLLPANELRRRAVQANPPKEKGVFKTSDLVEIINLDSTIKLDIRYATDNNFMGIALYDEPRAFLQRPAAEALVRVHRALANYGYGLVIYDAYRPWYVTKMFWDATPDNQKIFVANPAKGSRHNRGGAVDISLYDRKTGKIIDMVSGYDEFSVRAYPVYPGGTTLQRSQRQLLKTLMEGQGFTVNSEEWWHFDYREWKNYPILNLKFSELNK